MQPFVVNILGCGSALPTKHHVPSCQIVELRNKYYMLDCGEGAQLQMRCMHLSQQRVGQIFITHLHGDHCFGLMGLLSSMSLQGRTGAVDVFGPSPLKRIFQPLIEFFAAGAKFEIRLHEISHEVSENVWCDASATVTSVPLAHRMPCVGYVVKENKGLPHIRRDMIDFLSIPHYAINAIKNGGGWETPDGRSFSHSQLVTPPDAPRSYAYISDTMFCPEIIPAIRGVNILYHEATFAVADAHRAQNVMHSTSVDAATIAWRAHVGRLVLGHFSARYDNEDVLLREARAVFPDTILADECLRIEI